MMTAIKRRLAWMEACKKLKLIQSSNDWPEHLGLGVIGGLYNPDDWDILGGALRAAADAGELEVNRETQTVARQVQRGGSIRGVFSGAHPVDPSRMVCVETVETTQEIITASAASVARYLEGSDVDFPPLLLAWLSPHLAQGAESEQEVPRIDSTKAAARRSKPPTKMDIFLGLLERIEAAWVASGRNAIDRCQWPGTSKQLCILAGKLEPKAFGECKPKNFYENYARQAKLCFSKENDIDAAYAALFPNDGAAESCREAA